MFTKKNLHLGQHLIDYHVYQFMCPFYGVARDLKKNSGVKIDTFIMVKKKRNFWFYINLPEWQKTGKEYFEIVKQNPQKALSIINRIISYSSNLFNFCKIIPSIDKLKKIPDKELNKIYQEFHKWHHEFWSLAMTPNLLEVENSHLIDYVMGLIEHNKNKLSCDLPIFEILNIIIYFDDKTWIEKKNEDYYRLLIELKKMSYNKKGLIDKFYKKYCWMEYNWSGPVQDKKILLEQIKLDLKRAVDYRNELKSLHRERKEKLKFKAECLEKMNLNARDKILVKALEKLYFSKGYRMDCSYFAYSQMERVFQEIARRLHLSMNQARSILPYEMTDYLIRRKIDEDKLNALYNKSAIFWNGKEEKIYLGNKARKFIKSITEKDYVKGKEIDELKGQIAFRGKVRGIVKIINERKEIKKFKKGNILVSGHTDPSLMPAIIRAAAIVTNFGGMTCHAAIVSRELKKPCIIGTKIATKVLKDGDKVEVNANKGIVRKL